MQTRSKLFGLLSNITYSVSSNLVSLFITLILTLLLPKYIGVEDYGYWQLYIFYASYIGFLHFGWIDGLYLRYGGENYKDLNKEVFFSQFATLFIFQVICATIVLLVVSLSQFNFDKSFVLSMIAISLVLTNLRYMLLYVLQATYRMKSYSIVTISDRVLFLIFIAVLLIVADFDYKYLLYSDLLARGLSLVFASYFCKEIVYKNILKFRFTLQETYKNIKVGIKLMFSNIASKLMIGNVRFGIEQVWTIAIFGKISLMLSISAFTMIFINAVSLVLFPFLRQVKTDSLKFIYTSLRSTLMILLFSFLLLYFPLFEILNYWLPEYRDALKYLSLLFPMCIYEGKMSLLINTYLKVLRREKILLKVNVISLIFSLIFSSLSVFIFSNLSLAVLSITIVVGIRCIISELVLSQIINVNILKDIIWEAFLISIFIIVTWWLEDKIALFIYLTFLLTYLFFNRKEALKTIKFFKSKLFKRNNGMPRTKN